MQLIRYRFKTKSVDDWRPLIDMANIQMPWWCTGQGDDYMIIVCYLPEEEYLETYWDDAYDIEYDKVNEIIYNSRFFKPDWIKDI